MGSSSLVNNKKKKKSKPTTSEAATARTAAGSNSSGGVATKPDISFLKLSTAQLTSLLLLSMAISQAVDFRRLAQISSLAAVPTANVSSSFSEELMTWCGSAAGAANNATTTITTEDGTISTLLGCSLTDQIWMELKATSSIITTLLMTIVIILVGWKEEGWLQQFQALYFLCPLCATLLLLQVSQHRPKPWLTDAKCWQITMKTIMSLVLAYSFDGWILLRKSTLRAIGQPLLKSLPRDVFLLAGGFTLWQCFQLVQLGGAGWIPTELATATLSTDSATSPALLSLLVVDKLTQVVVYLFGYICLESHERASRRSAAQQSLLLGVFLLQWLERYLTRGGLQRLFQSYMDHSTTDTSLWSSSPMYLLQGHQLMVFTAFGAVALLGPTVTFQKPKKD